MNPTPPVQSTDREKLTVLRQFLVIRARELAGSRVFERVCEARGIHYAIGCIDTVTSGYALARPRGRVRLAVACALAAIVAAGLLGLAIALLFP